MLQLVKIMTIIIIITLYIKELLYFQKRRICAELTSYPDFWTAYGIAT